MEPILTESLSPSLLTSVGLGALLLANLLVKFWLASRQIRAVARHRDAVPDEFAQTIALDAHQRAADYTVAKLRLGLIELALGAAVLLGWTLLGGLDWLSGALLDWIGPRPLAQPLALLVAFALINALTALPLTIDGVRPRPTAAAPGLGADNPEHGLPPIAPTNTPETKETP